MPTIDEARLPISLLEHFQAADAQERVVLLLRSLTPLSAPGMVTHSHGR